MGQLEPYLPTGRVTHADNPLRSVLGHRHRTSVHPILIDTGTSHCYSLEYRSLRIHKPDHIDLSHQL